MATMVEFVSAYSSPRNFHQADRSIPERWLPQVIENPASPFFLDNRAVFQPFSIRPRNCLGRNLAYTEMRMILAQVLCTFGCSVKRVVDWTDRGPLMCKLTMRDDHGDCQGGH